MNIEQTILYLCYKQSISNNYAINNDILVMVHNPLGRPQQEEGRLQQEEK